MKKPLLAVCCVLLANLSLGEPLNISPERLDAFFASSWQVQRQHYDLSGAVISVVKDGEVIFNKGFGLADQNRRIEVDPDIHLFRIASISKPFTWIAVMQLVEQGKLDLDRDLNDYLQQFQIPNTFSEPITMRHLLNHNAGFEDNVLNLGRRSAAELMPLGEYLADHIPDRVRPPGQFSSYSNHSTALAAHVVEILSGQNWSSYIEDNILAPLEMGRTVARHPFPEALAPDRALSYEFKGGEWVEQEFLHWMIYPAGMMSTTGTDMGKFMLSLLAQGEGVLKPETHAEMLTPGYRPFEGANAWLHGFQQQNQNGVFAYGHGGDLNGYHSGMMLFPEHNLGFFASYNSSDGNRAQSDLMAAFVDHFFPEDRAPVRTPPENALEIQRDYHGTYAPLRRDFTDFAKLAMLTGTTSVSTTEDGYLKLSSSGGSVHYVATGPDRFVVRDGYGELNFVRSSDGKVTHMQFGNWPASSMDRLNWQSDPNNHRMLFALVVLICGLYVVYWPVKFVRRSYYGVSDQTIAPGYYLLAWLAAAGTLYSIVSLFMELSNPQQFYFDIPASIEILLVANLVVTGLGVLVAAGLVGQIIQGNGSLSERVNFTAYAFAAILFAYLGWFWNTITWYF